jgi:uncharacterized protein YbjT (DUF2867 family)
MDTKTTTPVILLVGATGPTGREVLARASALGISVRALARRPEALGGDFASHEIVRGDVLDRDSLVAALDGIEVVVSVLGTPLTRKPVTLLSRGTANLLAAMKTVGTPRIVCVTGMGAGDSRGHGGFLYDRLLLPLLLGQIYADKDRQEALLRAGDADWTIVRPAYLTDGPALGRYRVMTDLTGIRLKRISRKDVADFLLTEALGPSHRRSTVNLSD